MDNTIGDNNTFDEESENESDIDDISQHMNSTDLDMDNVFTYPYHLEVEEAVSMKKNYILSMAVRNNVSSLRVGVASSDYSCKIYDVHSTLKMVTSLRLHDSPVVNIRFAPDSNHLIYTGSQKGFIKLWDIRQNGDCVKHFKDTSAEKDNEKQMLSFDISCDGRFLCGGTELSEEAFVMFWDVRTTDLLGGYWESHCGDITQVIFHPNNAARMASGSTDGLINLYDISQSCEEDALLYSLNSESSVEKLSWHEKQGQQWYLSCITHTHVKIWDQDDVKPYDFPREKIASTVYVNFESLYVAGVHPFKNSNELLLLVGSNRRNGDCLRSASVNKKKLKPISQFPGNKQIVRCSWYDPNSEILLTAGEGSILSLWKPGQDQTNNQQTDLKMSSKTKPHKMKPY